MARNRFWFPTSFMVNKLSLFSQAQSLSDKSQQLVDSRDL